MRNNTYLRRTAALVAIALAVFTLVMVSPAGVADSESKDGPYRPGTTTTTVDLSPRYAQEAAALQRAHDLEKWNTAVWVHNTNVNTWVTKTNERLAAEEAARQEAARQEAARQEAARRAQTQETQQPVANTPSSGRCGGNLPPCCVMMRESGGSLTAQNPTSTASGKWQFINGTWNGYGGYAEAWMAPESVQDAKAAELWAGGAGASHWGGGC